ncbi:BQ5605_C003g02334 [Microbotryum silenes-dioicae]|uniref:BQ5605_C003g02334 protein n=1 Tax=Microbotryum silenes-dioicae TaxID=796604 RepID=A0A2X0M4W3_9BASI|nr:BQ5605_C003g02334 [Microbotryum silenes-dioicae]
MMAKPARVPQFHDYVMHLAKPEPARTRLTSQSLSRAGTDGSSSYCGSLELNT